MSAWDWPLFNIALAAAETTLNALLAMDAEVRSKLADVDGALVAVEIQEVNVTLYVSVKQGRLQLSMRQNRDPDLWVRGSPLDLLGLLGKSGEQIITSRRVAMDGDVALGHRLRHTLMLFSIDWEEQMSRLIGDFSAYQFGQMVRGFQGWARQTAEHRFADVGDYLQEERRLLPTRVELEHWLNAVDTLRDDVDRLDARLQRLRDAMLRDDV